MSRTQPYTSEYVHDYESMTYIREAEKFSLHVLCLYPKEPDHVHMVLRTQKQ